MIYNHGVNDATPFLKCFYFTCCRKLISTYNRIYCFVFIGGCAQLLICKVQISNWSWCSSASFLYHVRDQIIQLD